MVGLMNNEFAELVNRACVTIVVSLAINEMVLYGDGGMGVNELTNNRSEFKCSPNRCFVNVFN